MTIPTTIILLLAATVAGALPPPPKSHIHDPNNWITPQLKTQLTTHLQDFTTRNNIDVFIYIPSDQSPDPAELIALGNHWSQSTWGIITIDPDGLTQPTTTAGGPNFNKPPDHIWQSEINHLQSLAAREWNPQFQLNTLAHRFPDLIHFYREAPAAAAIVRKNLIQPHLRTAHQSRRLNLLRLLAILTLTLLTLLAATYLLFKFRLKKSPAYFPDTRWNPRLGAPHCGGNDLIRTFTPPKK